MTGSWSIGYSYHAQVEMPGPRGVKLFEKLDNEWVLCTLVGRQNQIGFTSEQICIPGVNVDAPFRLLVDKWHCPAS